MVMTPFSFWVVIWSAWMGSGSDTARRNLAAASFLPQDSASILFGGFRLHGARKNQKRRFVFDVDLGIIGARQIHRH